MDDGLNEQLRMMLRNHGISYNRTLGRRMQEVAREEWPPMPPGIQNPPERVWLSRDYLAALYRDVAPDGKGIAYMRLSVNRTRRDGAGWRDGITWDELQRVKNECLGPEVWCAEAYPAESAKVDVANIRHLYVLWYKPDWARLT